jgi:hypothetical protein
MKPRYHPREKMMNNRGSSETLRDLPWESQPFLPIARMDKAPGL